MDTAISSKQIGLPRFRALLLSLVVMLTMVLAPSVARADSTVTDLASLKTALTTGGIITLTADITVSEDLTINSGIPTTLKGNNKTITVTAGKHIGVAADNTLIVDQGITIKNEASSIVDTLVLVQKGSFKLTGGKIINTTGTPIHANIPKSIEVTSGEILGNSPVASGIAALNGGIVKISGGTITATGRDNACAIDTYDGVKTVISGGTFNATATEVSAKKNSVCVQGSGSIDFDLVGNTEIKLAAGLAYSDGMNYKRLHEPVTIPANFAAPIDNPFMKSLQTVTIDAATTDAALQATLVPSAGGKQALKFAGAPNATGTVTLKTASSVTASFKVKLGASAIGFAYSIVQGKDRFDTALKIASEKEFATSKEVILVNGNSPIDGVIAAPLAIARKAPVLYGTSADLGAEALAWVKTKGITKITTVGAGRVSAATKAGLAGVAFEEFTGVDRFDTAAKVAASITGAVNAYVADGLDLVDPMAAAVAAGQNKGVVLLSRKTDPVASTTDFLAGPGKSLVINAVGGPAAAAYPAAGNKIVGADRYATALLLAKSYITAPDKPVIATSGVGLVDAVPAAVLAALQGGALIYVKPGQKIDAAVAELKATTGQTPGEVLYIGILR